MVSEISMPVFVSSAASAQEWRKGQHRHCMEAATEFVHKHCCFSAFETMDQVITKHPELPQQSGSRSDATRRHILAPCKICTLGWGGCRVGVGNWTGNLTEKSSKCWRSAGSEGAPSQQFATVRSGAGKENRRSVHMPTRSCASISTTSATLSTSR
jgi:hypothetical protein